MTKTQPITFRFTASHDELGDLNYARQRVLENEHKTTVRIPREVRS